MELPPACYDHGVHAHDLSPLTVTTSKSKYSAFMLQTFGRYSRSQVCAQTIALYSGQYTYDHDDLCPREPAHVRRHVRRKFPDSRCPYVCNVATTACLFCAPDSLNHKPASALPCFLNIDFIFETRNFAYTSIAKTQTVCSHQPSMRRSEASAQREVYHQLNSAAYRSEQHASLRASLAAVSPSSFVLRRCRTFSFLVCRACHASFSGHFAVYCACSECRVTYMIC